LGIRVPRLALGDDRFWSYIDSASDYRLKRGGYIADGTLSGINNEVIDATHDNIDKYIGFRALVMINVITSLLVPNVSDWVRVDVTC
jgi:hypothetical protein